MRILLVEDDPMIGKTLQQALQQDGYAVDWATDGGAAHTALAAAGGAYAMVLLDLGLPRKSGIELLRELRREGNRVRVLVVTARDAVADRVAGLDAGADDYLTKPFSPAELVLRVKAILRRTGAQIDRDEILRIGDISINRSAHTVALSGQSIDLTPTEYKLLILLAERRGRVQARSHLLQSVWEAAPDIQTRTVDMHVQRLRTKLGRAGDLIETVRGFGYRIRPGTSAEQ